MHLFREVMDKSDTGMNIKGQDLIPLFRQYQLVNWRQEQLPLNPLLEAKQRVEVVSNGLIDFCRAISSLIFLKVLGKHKRLKSMKLFGVYKQASWSPRFISSYKILQLHLKRYHLVGNQKYNRLSS